MRDSLGGRSARKARPHQDFSEDAVDFEKGEDIWQRNLEATNMNSVVAELATSMGELHQSEGGSMSTLLRCCERVILSTAQALTYCILVLLKADNRCYEIRQRGAILSGP